MEKVIEAFRRNEMSMREAAKRFGVAQSVLSNRVNGITREKVGRLTTLCEFTEMLLVKQQSQ